VPGANHDDGYDPDSKAIIWDPESTTIYGYDGSEDWMNRPAYIGLGHELIHSYQHLIQGLPLEDAYVRNDKFAERIIEYRCIGLFPIFEDLFTENKLREEADLDLRPKW